MARRTEVLDLDLEAGGERQPMDSDPGGAVRIIAGEEAAGRNVARGGNVPLVGEIKRKLFPMIAEAGSEGVFHDGSGQGSERGGRDGAFAIAIPDASKEVFTDGIFKAAPIDKFVQPVQRDGILNRTGADNGVEGGVVAVAGAGGQFPE